MVEDSGEAAVRAGGRRRRQVGRQRTRSVVATGIVDGLGHLDRRQRVLVATPVALFTGQPFRNSPALFTR